MNKLFLSALSALILMNAQPAFSSDGEGTEAPQKRVTAPPLPEEGVTYILCPPADVVEAVHVGTPSKAQVLFDYNGVIYMYQSSGNPNPTRSLISVDFWLEEHSPGFICSYNNGVIVQPMHNTMDRSVWGGASLLGVELPTNLQQLNVEFVTLPPAVPSIGALYHQVECIDPNLCYVKISVKTLKELAVCAVKRHALEGSDLDYLSADLGFTPPESP
jgi:hypothetical protein